MRAKRRRARPRALHPEDSRLHRGAVQMRRKKASTSRRGRRMRRIVRILESPMHVRSIVLSAALVACGAAAAPVARAPPCCTRSTAPACRDTHRRMPGRLGTLVFENGLRETLGTWNGVLRPSRRRPTCSRTTGRATATATRPAATRRRRVVDELRHTLRESCGAAAVRAGGPLDGRALHAAFRARPSRRGHRCRVGRLCLPGIIKHTEDFPLATRVARRVFFSSTANREIDRIHATGDAVFALPAHERSR